MHITPWTGKDAWKYWRDTLWGLKLVTSSGRTGTGCGWFQEQEYTTVIRLIVSGVDTWGPTVPHHLQFGVRCGGLVLGVVDG